MPELFEKTTIKSMELKNRTVRSATWTGLAAAADGAVTDQLIELMTKLVRGGVGLIISGHAYVHPLGKASGRQLGIYDDHLLPGLKKMADAVHDAGGAMAIQLAHAGCHANQEIIGEKGFGPSVVSGKQGPICREITVQEIEEALDAFGMAAARAKSAGFDAVQIHAAHGYFLSQFLSPYYNKRTDEYGGPIENRAKAVIEVCRLVREAVGPEFPVLIKLNSEDFIDGGMTQEEMLTVARMLEAEGIDAIELSGGVQFSSPKLNPVRTVRIDSPEKEVFYRDAAQKYKTYLRTPLILVGGIRSLETAEGLIKEGTADYIAMSRPLIRNPELIREWMAGKNRISGCKSDNRCFKPALEGEGICCKTAEEEA